VISLTDANGIKLELTPVDSNGNEVDLSNGGGGQYGTLGADPVLFHDAHTASHAQDDGSYGSLGDGGGYKYDDNIVIVTNLTRVRVKDSQGNVVYQYTASFDNNMSSKGFLDAAGTSFGTVTYGSAVNPLRPTQFTDAMSRVWSYTWDTYGNLISSQTPRGLLTTYTYDYTQFPMGRLISVQEGTKPPTTITYYEPSGLINTVTSPAPSGSGVSTVQKSATYSTLGNLLSITDRQ
jgi:YD repeat-containing protein